MGGVTIAKIDMSGGHEYLIVNDDLGGRTRTFRFFKVLKVLLQKCDPVGTSRLVSVGGMIPLI